MPHDALRKKLKQLQDQMADGEPLDAEERRTLDDVLGQVEALLEAEDTDDDDSLADRVREAGLQFEESHPNLTAAIGAVADALSRLGI